METTKTTKTTAELIADGSSPLPLDVIPTRMGINLSSVEGLAWSRRADGQLVNLTINFAPSDRYPNSV